MGKCKYQTNCLCEHQHEFRCDNVERNLFISEVGVTVGGKNEDEPEVQHFKVVPYLKKHYKKLGPKFGPSKELVDHIQLKDEVQGLFNRLETDYDCLVILCFDPRKDLVW